MITLFVLVVCQDDKVLDVGTFASSNDAMLAAKEIEAKFPNASINIWSTPLSGMPVLKEQLREVA